MVPPNHPILIGVSIIFTIHFGGFPPIFGNIHIEIYITHTHTHTHPLCFANTHSHLSIQVTEVVDPNHTSPDTDNTFFAGEKDAGKIGNLI